MSGLLVEELLPLAARAARTGLDVIAAAGWPEAGDTEPPRLAGFVHSDFNPIVAAVAGRCLARLRESASPAAGHAPGRIPAQIPAQRDGRDDPPPADGEPVTAVVLVSDLGDADSAAHVAAAVDAGARIGPLFFFQSVPNAVLGHVAARWALTGPVSCVCDAASGLDVARGLLADGDADRVLLIELDHDEAGVVATAVLVAEGGPS